MAKIYAALIRKGIKTLDEVPARLRSTVEACWRRWKPMLEAWSRTRDGTRKLSANFTVAEFACKDGSDPVFVDSSLAALLQKIRDHFGRPVVITSGYRTAAHNKSVGGAAYSQHLYGRAADIRVQGIPVEQLAAYAETCLPGTGGIGRYPPRAGRAVGWVHVDTRPAKSRWTG